MQRVSLGLGAMLAVVAVAGVACRGEPEPEPEPELGSEPNPEREAGAQGAAADDDDDADCVGSADAYSNIHRDDYLGPEVCADCHAERHAQWRGHPHSRMNQDAGPTTVVGDFSGVAAEYGGIQTVFDELDGVYRMSFYLGDELLRRDRVTRTIGSRLQQAYVGVQEFGPEPADHPIYATERALAYVYWFSRGKWFPEHYVEQYPDTEYDGEGQLRYPTDDPYARGDRPWSEGCLLCHNTYAYEFRFNREVPGRGFEGATLKDCYRDAAPATGPSPEQLVTLGVSCEACHFGGREHVIAEREARAVPTSPKLVAWAPPNAGAKTLANPDVINSVCAQCHVASNLAHANTAATANSSEALDMLGGACKGAVRCTSCHDPHVASPPGGGPDKPEHVAACGTCHPAYADEPGRLAHSRHGAEQASCLDCHMQRITQGIDTVVRSHRIDSPSNATMLAAGGPNACNLCHLDQTISWTLDQLREGWGVDVKADPSWAAHYGEGLSLAVGQAWLGHGIPINRLIAADAYARSPLGRTALPELGAVLLDPYPNNRMFALMAIERILGQRVGELDYSPTADEDRRAAQVGELRAGWARD